MISLFINQIQDFPHVWSLRLSQIFKYNLVRVFCDILYFADKENRTTKILNQLQ